MKNVCVNHKVKRISAFKKYNKSVLNTYWKQGHGDVNLQSMMLLFC